MSRSDRLTEQRKKRTERLVLALDRRGWTKWRFQKELADRGTPGASRANVDRYLSGEITKPPIEFLIDSARLLNVPLLWLLGETDASTIEEAAAEDQLRSSSQREFWSSFESELARSFPAYEQLPESARGSVWSAFGTVHHFLMGSAEPPEDAVAGARQVGAALKRPLKELGIQESDLTEWQLARYVTSICQAIAFLNLDYGALHPRVSK